MRWAGHVARMGEEYPKMLGQTSGVTSLQQNKQNKTNHIDICAQTFFEVQLENMTLTIRMLFMRDGAAVQFEMMCAGCTYARRSHNIKIGNCPFERVDGFKYLGTTITKQNSIQEAIKGRLKSGNVDIIRFRIFCCQKIQRLRHTKL